LPCTELPYSAYKKVTSDLGQHLIQHREPIEPPLQ
jgi:hypothetical protein